ncbi:hypothetical protein BZA70DRAFT_282578 [Myxozyma melibiosi]|uniref:Arf-GAP domain-containing protein n=1 Tax=Myxozyma melibiosi TaxID=54550 RepID=A0ABR1F2Y8_9ASCO
MASKRQDKAQFERNQNVLKALLKEPGNKYCSDCKRNAYPRWASWNIGVFICIRCSGIHRSMGTHISRVKSVDLDSWTDEQLKSMVRWGNNKANKYWEARLPSGHQPVDTKMENFIRTKYEMKKWVAPGPIPDPDTMSDTEREGPIEPEPPKKTSTSSTKKYSAYASSPKSISSEDYKREPQLIGSVTARPASTPLAGPSSSHFHSSNSSSHTSAVKGSSTIRLKAEQPAAVRSPPPSEDLLGLGNFSSAPVTRASSANSNSIPSAPSQTANLRPDLKSSILSLYSQPRPQAAALPQGFSDGFATPQLQQPGSYQPSAAASSISLTSSNGNDLANPFGDMSISRSSTSSTAPAGPVAPSPVSATTATPSSDPFAGLMSSNAWSTPTSTSSASKPMVTLDDDLDNEFGSFNSAAFSSTNAFASPPPVQPTMDFSSIGETPVAAPSSSSSAAIGMDFFDSPSFANPIPLNSGANSAASTPAATSAPANPLGSKKGSVDEIFNNVWG